MRVGGAEPAAEPPSLLVSLASASPRIAAVAAEPGSGLVLPPDGFVRSTMIFPSPRMNEDFALSG